MESTIKDEFEMANMTIFNPFRIFDKLVARKFLIRPRDYDNYTEEQLDELVHNDLRMFVFDNETWFLAKDVCSYLGITPDHISRALKNLDDNYKRQENVILSMAPSSGAVSKVPTRAYKLYLINESGIYALIQKSKTIYAEEFKKWLNEEVLPEIRKTGSFTSAPEVAKEINAINSVHENEVMGVKFDTKEEVEAQFQEIIKEKDKIIEEEKLRGGIKDGIIEHQRKEHLELMSFLSGISKNIEKLQDENRVAREENKATAKAAKEQIQTLQEENTKQIQALQEENKSNMASLKSDIKKLQDKMEVVVKDRVARPADEGKLGVFAVYYTEETENIEDRIFSYVIIKCQIQNLRINENRLRKRYPNSHKIFSIENPSAESLFQVLKERIKKTELGVKFSHTSLYFTDADAEIDDVLDIVREIDRERVEVD